MIGMFWVGKQSPIQNLFDYYLGGFIIGDMTQMRLIFKAGLDFGSVRLEQLLIAVTALFFFVGFIFQMAKWESYRPLGFSDYLWFAILSFLTNFGLFFSVTPLGKRWNYFTLCLIFPSILMLICASLGHGFLNIAGFGVVVFAAYRMFLNKENQI